MAHSEVLTKIIPHLWTPQPTDPLNEPLYHLRISVLKDHETQGDCESQTHVFKTQEAFQNACDVILSTFGGASSYGCTVKCSEMETLEFEDDDSRESLARVLTIVFDSGDGGEKWDSFRERLLGVRRGLVEME